MTTEHIERILNLSKKLTDLAVQFREAIDRDEPFEVVKAIQVRLKETQKEIAELQEKHSTENL